MRKPPPISRKRKADPAPTSASIERRLADEALQKSEQKYRALLEAAPDGIVVANGDGRITEVNRQTEMMFGYEWDELVDEPVELLIPERLRQAHVRHRKVYAADPRTRTMGAGLDQFTGRRKDGSEFSIDVALSTVEQGEGALTMAVIRDITERKRTEKALQTARESLEGRVERQMLQRNPYKITFREFIVLHHVAAGKADKEIAHELGISPLTVHKHVANILSKMNAGSRTEAGVRALREGLLD